MVINKYLVQAFKKLGKPQKEIIADLEQPQPYVSALMNGKKSVGKDVAKKLHDLYGFDIAASMTGILPSQENKFPKSELKPKTYNGGVKVRLVTNTAKAGWESGFYADEYLKDLPFVLIEADENYKGRYMAFEVEGDSMEPDYIEGDIVICREIQRHHWQSKLHYNDWDFVIAHATKGIFLKEISNHDVDKGIITCHSLNPNYKDFEIDLREVAFLYNIVETRQQGKRKRLNRAKDYFETEE